jgi:two-component system sensor histidine kinase PilS (NtrC family)
VKPPEAAGLLRALSWARLGLAALIAILVALLPEDLAPGRTTDVLVLALVTVAVSSAALLRARGTTDPHRIAWLVGLLDVVLVTAVVAATGGARSLFTFLYVLTVIASCVLLSRMGGLAMAAAASALYTGLVFGRTIFPVTALFEPPEETTTALEVLTMFLNTGTLLVVAILAGGLAERIRETRQRLEAQERDLRDVQAFRDLIFHSAGSGLIALDRDGRITAFNRAAEEMSGRTAGEASGRRWEELFGGRLPLAAIEAALGAAPRTPARHETTLHRPDGGAVPVRLTLSPLLSGDGARLGLIAVCEDLTVIREMEARVRQADRLASLGRMAANIAHEIRNPLASMSGAIEALAADLPPGEDRARLSQIVLRESDRLNGIIKNFLEYARPAPLALQPVNVSEAIDDVLVLLEHRPRPATVKIARDFPPAIVWRLDSQQFRQALWNLCLNAVEAMPEGGELTVGASVQGGHLRIRVADTGEGIAPGELAHVFEPFYSTKTGGSGLGLALVHRIVTEHGGQVDVQSAPGDGTTITLTLAVRDA